MMTEDRGTDPVPDGSPRQPLMVGRLDQKTLRATSDRVGLTSPAAVGGDVAMYLELLDGHAATVLGAR